MIENYLAFSFYTLLFSLTITNKMKVLFLFPVKNQGDFQI